MNGEYLHLKDVFLIAISAVLAGVISVFTWFVRRQYKINQRQREVQKALENGMQALLKDSIIKHYYEYHEMKKHMPLMIKDVLENLYNQYISLAKKDINIELRFREMMELPETQPQRAEKVNG